MDKTQAQTEARNLAAALAAALSDQDAEADQDDTWAVLEAKSGEAWSVSDPRSGTQEQQDTTDFAIWESRTKPGVWCVVEYQEGAPAFCYPSPDVCFPLSDF